MTVAMETFTVVVFVLSYIGIAFGTVPPLALDRTGFALLGAIILVAGGSLTVESAIHAIDTSTLLLLYALMVVSAQLRLGGFYTYVALKVASRVHSPVWFLLLLMVAVASLSAVLTNDVVCLAFTPVVVAALLEAKLHPVPFLLGLAMASNIGSAATIIGNPQNMLIGQVQKLDFAKFVVFCLPPSVLVLAVAFGILVFLYRGRWQGTEQLRAAGTTVQGTARSEQRTSERGAPAATRESLKNSLATTAPQTSISETRDADGPLTEWPPFNLWQTTKGLCAVAGVIVFFFTSVPRELTALTAAGLLLLSRRMRSRWLLGFVDWHLLTLFCGLFIIIAALTSTGLPDLVVRSMKAHGVDLHDVNILSGVSVVLSNLVSNVPATMLLLKFVDPTRPVESYALALSSTYAGNLITLGSIANLIVIEQAGRLGVRIGFWEYARAGVPVTLASLLIMGVWLALVK